MGQREEGPEGKWKQAQDGAPPMGLQLGPLPSKGTPYAHAGACLLLARSASKGRAALPTCPCLQVQLLQHNVEKEEDGLHELGDGVGVSRAPGKRE